MVGFSNWCQTRNSNVGSHTLTVLTVDEKQLSHAAAVVAKAIPAHYASSEHIAKNLERLGKDAAAKFVREKLPLSKRGRSGDLGEILATEYIAERLSYDVPIRRLRWKDHRELAMRGTDVIAVRKTQQGRLQFLKTEAKSRVALPPAVVGEARGGLANDGGLPSDHTLSFLSQRLFELGNTELADAIDNEQLELGIQPSAVAHLLFVLSGNDATAILTDDLTGYSGDNAQYSVGLRVKNHAAFVASVFEQVTT
jgi:hypothetical protein